MQTNTLETVRGQNLLLSLWKIMESLSLEQTSEIIQSNFWLITMSTRPWHTTRPSVTSSHFWNTSRDGDCLPPPWACHCLTTLSIKKFLLMSTWISPGTTWGYVLSSWKFQISVQFILKLPKPYAESKDCISAWRRECSKRDFRAPSSTWRRPTRYLERDFYKGMQQ